MEEISHITDGGVGDLRCFQCNKLLAKKSVEPEVMQIKCNRCGSINSLFKGSDEQVVITDPSGVILYTNNLIEKVTGYTPAEVVGKTPSLWGGQMPSGFYEEMWKKISDEKRSVLVKVTNKRKDGQLYDALLRISPILDTDGEIKLFIGIETVIEPHT